MTLFPDTPDDNLVVGDKHIKITGDYRLDTGGQILFNGQIPGSGGGIDLGGYPRGTLGVGAFNNGSFVAVAWSNSGTLISNGTVRYTPFVFAVDIPMTSMVINVAAAASDVGASCRLGIYTSVAGIPSSLVIDAGTVDITTTGQKTLVVSQTLFAGAYWVAAAFQTPTTAGTNPTLTSWGLTWSTVVQAVGSQQQKVPFSTGVSGAFPSTASFTYQTHTTYPAVEIRTA